MTTEQLDVDVRSLCFTRSLVVCAAGADFRSEWLSTLDAAVMTYMLVATAEVAPPAYRGEFTE